MNKYWLLLTSFIFFSCRPIVNIFDNVEDAISYESSIMTNTPNEVNKLNVMTWNIRYGAGRIPWFEDSCGDRVHMTQSEVQSNLQGIISFLNNSEDSIDILLLQEVDVSSKRSAYMDQVQYLLDNTYFNYGAYGSMWQSDFIPSGGLGKVDVGVAILSRWKLSELERIQLPLREDQPSYEKYFYLRRCIVKAKLNVPNWDDLYIVNIHAASFSTDDTKQKHILEYRNLLDGLHNDGYKFVTGGDLNAIPPGAQKYDFCLEDQCIQDSYLWHTAHSGDSINFHRKGSYYNNFLEDEEYLSERNLLQYLYEKQNYFPAIAYSNRNESINFSYGAYNLDNQNKSFYDRKLDYLFTNHSNWSETGKTFQETTKLLSDHMPISATIYKD